MMIPLWYGLFMGASTAYLGFWYGRSRNWGLFEKTKEPVTSDQTKEMAGNESRRKRGRYLASPSGGIVERMEGENGVRIMTEETKLYAPSSGRVLSVAPRGNAFLILTDWGEEVEVRACGCDDDLLDHFFRPRVIRGEIIRKGKLLLEYDREKLSGECEDMAVYLMARGEEKWNMELADVKQVKTGEVLYWVN